MVSDSGHNLSLGGCQLAEGCWWLLSRTGSSPLKGRRGLWKSDRRVGANISCPITQYTGKGLCKGRKANFKNEPSYSFEF